MGTSDDADFAAIIQDGENMPGVSSSAANCEYQISAGSSNVIIVE